MKKEMLINVSQPEECRIAIIEDGVLEELYVERTSQETYVGNIYKGRVVNIEPSIQAVFIDFGIGRNGFLHVSDVEPAYYRDLEPRSGDRGDRGGRGHRREGGGGGGRDRGRGERPHRSQQQTRRHDLPETTDFIHLDDEPEQPGQGQPASRPFDDLPDVNLPLSLDNPEGGPAEGTLETPPRDEANPPENGDKGRSGRGRRGRGRGRRGRGQPDSGQHPDPALEGGGEGAAGSASERESPVPDAPKREDVPPEPPRPRLMDSAERRTEREDMDPSAGEPSSSRPDDDIFFPRADARGEDDGLFPKSDVLLPREPAVDFGASVDDFENDRDTFPSSPAELPEESGADDFDETPQDDRFEDEEERGFQESDDDGDDDGLGGSARRSSPSDRGGRGGPGGRGGDRRGGGQGRRGPGRPGGGFGRPKPLIQDIFKRGQEVLVQVIKEGIGTKGPTLSTYISIAGRYLVLMPGLNRIGVSRKIEDEDQRRRLREIMNELEPPKGLGFIIRTAGLDRNKKDLQRDLAYLSRLWKVIVGRIKREKSPTEIYKESDMITRTIRDTFTNEIDTIWVDEPSAYEHAKEFLTIVMPRYANRIKLFSEAEPLFHKSGIEEEIARIQKRHVPLPRGGSLVIDQTEALVAIDVNSGNFRADNNNAEETAYQMNMGAAKEIARQLRLRDLGGVIVNDFIDMRDEKHRRDVERALRDAVRRDRARTKILKTSAFGMIEMTRQRIRPSLKRSVYQDCEHCHSTGQVKTCESMSIDVMRMLQLGAHRPNVHRIEIHVAQDVANYLLNKKRREIAKLEEARGILVNIIGWSTPPPEAPEIPRRPGGPLPMPHRSCGVSPEMLQFICYDNNNPPNIIHTFPLENSPPPRPGRR